MSINTVHPGEPIIIIGIDHGYGNIKTAHCCFKTGVAVYDKEPTFKSNLLVYEGRYYLIGEEHKEFAAYKMQDLDYYILTLAAIARELNIRKLTSARIHLAVGLPLTWVSEQKEAFKAYLLQNEIAEYSFRGIDYHVQFAVADVFPQGFAAVADKLSAFKGINMLCDIGNGTMNVMYINECKPQQNKCFTEKYGTHQCMLAVRENLMKLYGTAVDDSVIERVIRHGTADISERYLIAIRDTAAEYERISKYPKSTKFGRQNPISERWNSDEQLLVWREVWADMANKYLALYPWVDERIDHRSHAARGIDEQPTIHEGVIARALEQKGVVSDRCEINRQIKVDNKLLRELKVRMEHLLKTVKDTIPAIAEAMETIRHNMLIFRYQLLHTRASKRKIINTLNAVLPDFRKYTEIVKHLKDKMKERRDLLAGKKATPVLRVAKQMELSRQIAALTEDIEELRSEKNMLLDLFNKSDDAGMKEIRQWVDSMEASLQRLEQSDSRYTSELDKALAQYAELREQTTDMNAAELGNARWALRQEKEQDAIDMLKNAYGKQYDCSRMQQAEKDVNAMLGAAVKTPSVRQQLHELSRKQEPRQRKHKKHEQER